ncbi:hypothetical protein SEA_CHARM_51 [Mycobacterium phage Charm]|nr:hypothetical protein SEA_CHARM_51 [Mycobacterium phage Charm]
MDSVFDGAFNGPGSELYRAEVSPDLWPNHPRMRLENWPADERAPFIGGDEAKAFYRLENTLAELRAVPQRIMEGSSARQ